MKSISEQVIALENENERLQEELTFEKQQKEIFSKIAYSYQKEIDAIVSKYEIELEQAKTPATRAERANANAALVKGNLDARNQGNSVDSIKNGNGLRR